MRELRVLVRSGWQPYDDKVELRGGHGTCTGSEAGVWQIAMSV